MVRDEAQLAEVRKKLKEKYKLKLEPPFRCDFRDPWGNRIQVVDLHGRIACLALALWRSPKGRHQIRRQIIDAARVGAMHDSSVAIG